MMLHFIALLGTSYSSLLTWLQTFLYDQILTCGFKLDIAKELYKFPVNVPELQM